MNTLVKFVVCALAFTTVVVLLIFPFNYKYTTEYISGKIKAADIISISALLATLIGAGFSFFYKSKADNLSGIEKQNTELKIATAKQSAAEANAEAQKAKHDAALANQKAAESNMEAARLKERALQAEIKSNELEERILRLKLSVGDRYIPKNIAATMKSKLQKFSSRNMPIYCSISNTQEPLVFSDILHDFFRSLGWNSNVIDQYNIRIPAPKGIKIITTTENCEIANIINEQFDAIGYDCKVIIDDSFSTGIAIFVYAR